MRFGPTVEVAVGVHDYFAKRLEQEGKRVAGLVIGNALIDTGATTTTIDIRVAEELGLPRSGTVQSVGIGGASAGYRAACSINIKGLRVSIPRAHCHPLPESSGLIALIGRDILRHMVLEYDGVNGTVALTIPAPSPPTRPTLPSAKPGKMKKHKRRRR